jgi:hypothetical protein
MMTAADYRAKAEDALVAAQCAPDPKSKLDWEATAKDWAGLAVQAEAQEALERRLWRKD